MVVIREECSRRDKGPRHCVHHDRNNHSPDKCWDKFSKPKCFQIAEFTSTLAASSPTTASIMQISQIDYDCFIKLQTAPVSQPANSTMHGSALGTSAFTAFSDKPWVIDLGAFTHMTCIKNKFHSLSLINSSCLVLLMIPLSLLVKKKELFILSLPYH